ncbi:proton channel OTOP3 [Sorex fumeus]|uniref:proton channel OTOP3 n=1 Tax=Sorex fumeus TaxID=62283 RepID=UPI0024AE27A7|nr:proton channel OTOP3 [Sorex fumeus]
MERSQKEKQLAARRAQHHHHLQQTGQLFSGLLCLNVVLLGTAVICSMIFNSAVTLHEVGILLAICKIISLLWFLYYMASAMQRPWAVNFQDTHAGSIWVRGSLVLFGGFTICLNVFRVGYSVSHLECKEQLELVLPFIEMVFIGVQTWVLWKHAKDCAQVQTNITRCGLMLSLATNLLLWILAVTNDSMHLEIEEHLFSEKLAGNITNSSQCMCPSGTLCDVFQKGFLMLYPFRTEYCLICCTVLFVMWKNVGRSLTHHASLPRHAVPFRMQGAIFGPLLGALAMVAGVFVFVLFQIQASGSSIALWYFTLYYAFYVAILLLMSLACLTGLVIHELEERELDMVENPTRSLDVALLLGMPIGQMAIAYFSLVAIMASRSHEQFSDLLLAYSLLVVLQHVLQNLFIIGDLHRQPLWETAPRSPDALKPEVELNEGHSLMDLGQNLRRLSTAYLQSYSNLNWKRRMLKEVSFFLILCNITLWVMPAFGIHPEFKNGLEKDFYGYHAWFTIVNFGLPLGVFYRMHSVGTLVEVYLGA